LKPLVSGQTYGTVLKSQFRKIGALANQKAKQRKEKEKMQISKSKTTATAVSMFLLLAIAISIVALPNASAQSTKLVYPYIGAVPNPVGVGQEVLLHLGITDANAKGAGYGWEGLTVTVERPDGKTETLGPFMTDSTGGTGTVYVPTLEGTYYLQTNFPQQWYNYTSYGREYSTLLKAATSEKLPLNVTTEPIKYYPAHALPTEYWTRPIDPQLREWSVVAGSWLESTPMNKFAVGNDGAPDTAHVLWTKVLTTGGLVGEES
jgi:hypothetical protein